MILTSNDPQDELLTVDELCRMLRVTRDAIYQRRARGSGPTAYRLGRRLFFKRRDVMAWVEAQREMPAEPIDDVRSATESTPKTSPTIHRGR